MAEHGPGNRWSGWSKTTALLVVGAVGVVVGGLVWIAGGDGKAAGLPDGVVDGGPPPVRGAPGEVLRWNGARLVRGAPDQLILYFVGSPPGPPDDPCAGAYQATAEPGGDRMTVTVRRLSNPLLRPGTACTSLGYESSLTVELPEPLRGRPVVDGASGEERPVSDAASLLRPSWLPPGYRFVQERVELGIDSRTWAPDGRQDVRLLVDQGDADKLGSPGFDPVVLARPVVRGAPATVWKTRRFDDLVCVSWAEGTTGHQVCTSGAPGKLLPIEELVRVADGLRN